MTHTNTREDQYGSSIGNGTSHVQYHAINTAAFPQVNVTVNTSGTTESVYVTYTNNDNAMSTTVRFSNHMSNAVMFGDQLDGALATELQILFRIGGHSKRGLVCVLVFGPHQWQAQDTCTFAIHWSTQKTR